MSTTEAEVFVCDHEDGGQSPVMSNALYATKDKSNLSMWQVVGVLFVATVGGAYGIEDCVRSGGGLGTILGVAIAPWVWGLPTAFVVAELATCIPSNAGASMWVNVAFPSWVTLSFIICTGVSNFVDNSLYPNLLVQYLLPATTAPVPVFTTKIVMIVCATAVNILGIDLVGNFGMAFTVLTTLPFLLLFLTRLPDISLERVLNHTPKEMDWTRFLPLLSWNISGLDGAGHIVEEIEAPNRNMIKGFVCLLLLTQVVYIFPIVAATSLPMKGEAPELWGHGHWVNVGEEAGGHILAVLLMVGGAISCFGFMTALLCTTSRALQGFATMKVFPERINEHLARVHPVYHTPVPAIVVNSCVTLLLSASFDFSLLVDVGQMMYSMRLLFIFASLVVIRRRHPSLKRPFTIPGGVAGLVLATALPSLYCCVLIIAGVILSAETASTVLLFVFFSMVFSCMTTHCFEMDTLEGRIKKTRVAGEREPTVTWDSLASSQSLAASLPNTAEHSLVRSVSQRRGFTANLPTAVHAENGTF